MLRPQESGIASTSTVFLTKLATCILLAGSANASIVTSTSNAPSNGFTIQNSSVSTPNPGNDNVLGASTNTLQYDTAFSWVGGPWSTGFGVGGGAATEYSVDLKITNNSAVTLTDYTLYVGGGTMDFPIYTNWFIFDFDQAPTLTGAGNGVSWSSSPNDNWLSFSNLNLTPGSTMSIGFNLDLPVNASGNWQIQHHPAAVPEPFAVNMFKLGLLGLIGAARRLA